MARIAKSDANLRDAALRPYRGRDGGAVGAQQRGRGAQQRCARTGGGMAAHVGAQPRGAVGAQQRCARTGGAGWRELRSQTRICVMPRGAHTGGGMAAP